mgnify:CR=1 FL=1
MIVRKASDEGHVVEWFNARMHVTLPREDAESVEIVHELFPGSADAPLNTHPEMEQVYFIISGSGIAIVGEEQSEIGAGDLVYIPRNAVHAVRSGASGLEYICINSFPNGYPADEPVWADHERVVRKSFGFPPAPEANA